MNIVLLDKKTLGDDLDLSALATLGNLVNYETTSAEQTLERVKNSEIIISNKVVINKEIMQQSPKLKLICIAATGMNNVDLNAAKELGITVKNVSGYSTSSVLQHTFSMMFYLLEKLEYYNQQVKSKTWSKSGLFTDVSQPFSELSTKTWGIIGLGTIGKEVAKMANNFGAKVYYHSTSGQNLKNEYQHYALNDLLKNCDIVSIHCPLNEQTMNLINKSNLSHLKDNAILLNLGRGGIVNEADLAIELNKRALYAGLDVLAKEPIEEKNPLLNINNPQKLLITPHLAWASFESRTRLLDGIIKNIESYLEEIQL
ncbi:MAG: D-3-phosphoglycerate dehydrogenase (EC [uncultured Sulfurovum sp.]|uniref:D-3-phosphoglycerate dehydrogenase (EC) n=1 Tax=uncultured Sulfurovum sp. TaxID=269237 RepID=A0A6S6TQE7_9BACT|nr:MAG: D-3-phosphoglycerate dehydrogenase (EC [uncultured Sulfurovum sp.]